MRRTVVSCNSIMRCEINRQGGHKSVVLNILNKHFFEIMNMVKYFRNLFYNINTSKEQEESVEKPQREANDATKKLPNEILNNDTEAEERYRENQMTVNEQSQLLRASTDVDKLNSISEKMLEIQETMNSFASHVFEQEMKTSESLLISS